LIYLFYGRPAYRSSNADVQSSMLEIYPITLIFRPDSTITVKRILPMDSGALVAGLYKDFIHEKQSKESFEVPPPLENVRAIVYHFYGTNANYLNGQPKQDILQRDTQFELAGIKRLASRTGVTRADDRRHTIEIQSNTAIAFDISSLIGVVAPAPFEDEPYFKDMLEQTSALCKYYDCDVARPREIHGVVMGCVKSIFETLGYLE
jgi:hypothetical protein